MSRTPTPKEFHAWIQLRSSFDAIASQLAADAVANGAEDSALLNVYEQLDCAAESGSYEKFHKLDEKLHCIIVEMANVPGMLESWKTIVESFEYVHRAVDRICWSDLRALCEGHRELVDTICAGSPVEAEVAAIVLFDAIRHQLPEGNLDVITKVPPLARACSLIALRLHTEIRLTHLSKEVCVSPGHLCRMFQNELGLNYREYLKRLRINKAAHLLTQSSVQIQKIANRVGYQDCSRFSQHFRQCKGVTPSGYRTQRHEVTRNTRNRPPCKS